MRPKISNLLRCLQVEPGFPDSRSYQSFIDQQKQDFLNLNLFQDDIQQEAFPEQYYGCDLEMNIDEDIVHDTQEYSLDTYYPTQNYQQQEDDNSAHDIEWLLKETDKIAINTGLNSDNLFDSIVKIILSNKDSAEIQNELLDLVGYDSFEFLTELISYQKELRQAIGKELNKPTEEEEFHNRRMKELNKNTKAMYGNQVTVMFESEKNQMKQYRKEVKKSNKNTIGKLDDKEVSLNPSELKRLREEALRKGPSCKGNNYDGFEQEKEESYPNVFKEGNSSQNSLSIYGTKYHLPVGTIRVSGEYYDEITIPIKPRAPTRTSEKTIYLEDMDSLCKETFKKYTSLNRVQSIVYPIAYKTNENMLLCAPTGAGKTDVAMLTILRTLYAHCTPTPTKDNLNQLKINKSAFKIVYVAPMKALATEIVTKMGTRLKWLGIQVRELTGDMQLTKDEILKTQIIVTTPEKWDVVTRKGTGDLELVQKLKLLVIDEVHLLHDDRGSVIESIVARTLRQVESTQSMIRIVGLSATLPNYVDVSKFLKVNPYKGLFFFDGGFRPVPLEQHFLGVRGKPGTPISNLNLDRACFEKVEALLSEGHQVMVFVHTRKETVRVAKTLIQMAAENGVPDLFSIKEEDLEVHSNYSREVSKSRNNQLKELFKNGVGAHHAGMLRSDRLLTEKMFADGALKLLCCTATLAWGVNLPAYAVVIRGTQVYDAQKGSFVDLSILDVLQIFGRAGRPQYEDQGVGYILTTGDKLSHFVSAITQQHPIESNFINNIIDNLCAEICLGTVANIDEAVTWLSYTFLYIRMQRNPMIYGITYQEAFNDPYLGKKRHSLIVAAAKSLQQNNMIYFDVETGFMSPRDLGRISSLFYVSFNSMDILCSKMKLRMGELDCFEMVACSKEFENIKVRENETNELNKLMYEMAACPLKNGINNSADKVNLLMQTYISKGYPEDFALISDLYYVSQNAARIFRSTFEVALNRNWGNTAYILLSLCKSIEHQMWSFEHPLAQFQLSEAVRMKLEQSTEELSINELRKLDAKQIGELINFERLGPTLYKHINEFPLVNLNVIVQPLIKTVLKITIQIQADFKWNDRIHGNTEAYWIWIEDQSQLELYFSEKILLKKITINDPIILEVNIPALDPLPDKIYVRAISDRWLGSETLIEVSLNNLILPQLSSIYTNLLDTQLLSISALNNPILEEYYSLQFNYFNPIQTHCFYSFYKDLDNVFLATPINSGENILMELAIFNSFQQNPNSKIVYINSNKQFLSQRKQQFNNLFNNLLNKKVIELTGSLIHDFKAVNFNDIILTTPEDYNNLIKDKYKLKGFQQINLILLDQLHLLDQLNGHLIEIIISRIKYQNQQTQQNIRIIGLSSPLSNSIDFLKWLNIKNNNFFNFRPSVRPIPLELNITGFPGNQYLSRMASMNRPIYKEIQVYSKEQSTIVFVSSRKQGLLTAKDLIAFCGLEENPRQFLNLSEIEFDLLTNQISDKSLKLTLSFGIGLYHTGLTKKDLKLVEELFNNNIIKVLISTYQMTDQMQFGTKLVIIKGTEYFNTNLRGYKDHSISTILKMMSKAGRNNIDYSAKTSIFVYNRKVEFYRKFLNEPFPIESILNKQLIDLFNGEIASKIIKNKKQAMEYLKNTFLYQRVIENPAYYGIKDKDTKTIEEYLLQLINKTVDELIYLKCLDKSKDDSLVSSKLGKIASIYSISCQTMNNIFNILKKMNFELLFTTICSVKEFNNYEIKFNEEKYYEEIKNQLPLSLLNKDSSQAYYKVLNLLQIHMTNRDLPDVEVQMELKQIILKTLNILEATLELCLNSNNLKAVLITIQLIQGINEAQWPQMNSLDRIKQLKGNELLNKLSKLETPVNELKDLLYLKERKNILLNQLKINKQKVEQIENQLIEYPIVQMNNKIVLQGNKYSINQTIMLEIIFNVIINNNININNINKNWYVLLVDENKNQVIANKKVTMITINYNNNKGNGNNNRKQFEVATKLEFITPNQLGDYNYKLMLLPQGYCDVNVNFDFKFIIE
ncbi:Sec63-domain-containing protein [Neoconidiobolus thromboides FSU 785]|nr:Sec63-domain-containing protein [Neoconidiobolus thromboides FSU 785]